MGLAVTDDVQVGLSFGGAGQDAGKERTNNMAITLLLTSCRIQDPASKENSS